MRIGIIGAGNIGATLGRAWVAADHDVMLGVRDPQDNRYAALHSGQVGGVGEAAMFGDAVVLALPGAAVADFVARHGSKLAGKVVVDATNNVRAETMNSLATLIEHAPGARLVRAFSTLGWENFANPQIGGNVVDLFYCGDPAARPLVEELISDVGLRPVYIGGVDNAAALDGMTRVWFALTREQGLGRRVAFKLLKEK